MYAFGLSSGMHPSEYDRAFERLARGTGQPQGTPAYVVQSCYFWCGQLLMGEEGAKRSTSTSAVAAMTKTCFLVNLRAISHLSLRDTLASLGWYVYHLGERNFGTMVLAHLGG